ncbi:MAG: 3-oxoacyl-ACP synthase [Firmicutes bacterium HGW-Firmicutes-12]|jgi:3-oxoacyl-[acyl-carrier-protein] synthase-3|nr:MAG: 3-oxoacyl-ACP synthase [Firmicutes bacterium HGW-Firmicutes-12]
MKVSPRSAGIVGLGTYLPAERLTNADLEKIIDTSDEWIRSRTGISERRRVASDEAASDMGVKSALKALESAGIKPEEVDLIIVPTITPDMVFPSTSSIVQDKIGAINAAAFDISAGCTGFIYALSTANQFVASGAYDTVLVVATEAMTRFLNWEDRNTCVLFGDGSGAAVIRPVDEGEGFLSFVLGSDGSGSDLLKIPAGGSRTPATDKTLTNKEHFIQMSGNEVFRFAVKIMGEAAINALDKAGLTKEDVDFLVPHQANTRIIEAAAKRLGLPQEKVFINLDKYGNMSSASIPVALEEATNKGLLKKGDLIVLVGFGAGLTWGASVMRWLM